jgi:arsenite methyltransferase
MTQAPPDLDLKDLLGLVDKAFGIDRVLSDQGRDVIAQYYAQSGPTYEQIHSRQGCMHLALNPDGAFSYSGYQVQPDAVIQELRRSKATAVLELGCGKGFNSLYIAQHLPDMRCTGTDLLDAHVVKARAFAHEAGQKNVTYEQASFEPLPDRFRGFDLAFGFETLCYAQDLDLVAGSIAAALRPGGRFVMYDVHAWDDPDVLPKDIAMATRLYETSMAVTRGFIRAGKWETALARAGLVVDPTQDLSQDVQPGLKRLQDMGIKALGDWKKRLAIKVMPPYMARNSISALFGPLVYRLDGQPKNMAVLAYQKITATKPA